jgi:uncharacterized membrane protein YgcG
MTQPIRIGLLAVATLLPLPAQDPAPPLQYATSVAEAESRAQAEKKPILWVIMMDNEKACDRMLQRVYPDREVRARLDRFVLLPSSLGTHEEVEVPGADGPVRSCPHFPGVRCAQHQAIEKEVRTRFDHGAARGEVIAPQHIVTSPDGKILARRFYEMQKSGLLGFLDEALGTGTSAAAGTAVPPSAETRLQILFKGTEEERVAVARELESSGEKEARAALAQALVEARIQPDALRIAVIRGLGRREHAGFAPEAARLLADKTTLVRHATVVTLEDMANPVVGPELVKLWASERDPELRKDLLRALGPAAGGIEAAREILLKELNGSAEILRVPAAMGLGHHLSGEETVRAALKSRWKKSGSGDTRLAILYAYFVSGDSAVADDLLEFAAEERNGELRQLIQAVRSHLTGEDFAGGGDSNGRGRGGGGGGGGRGGRGGGRGGRGGGGGMEAVLFRGFAPLFAKDRFERNVIREIRERFPGRGGR